MGQCPSCCSRKETLVAAVGAPDMDNEESFEFQGTEAEAGSWFAWLWTEDDVEETCDDETQAHTDAAAASDWPELPQQGKSAFRSIAAMSYPPQCRGPVVAEEDAALVGQASRRPSLRLPAESPRKLSTASSLLGDSGQRCGSAGDLEASGGRHGPLSARSNRSICSGGSHGGVGAGGSVTSRVSGGVAGSDNSRGGAGLATSMNSRSGDRTASGAPTSARPQSASAVNQAFTQQMLDAWQSAEVHAALRVSESARDSLTLSQEEAELSADELQDLSRSRSSLEALAASCQQASDAHEQVTHLDASLQGVERNCTPVVSRLEAPSPVAVTSAMESVSSAAATMVAGMPTAERLDAELKESVQQHGQVQRILDPFHAGTLANISSLTESASNASADACRDAQRLNAAEQEEIDDENGDQGKKRKKDKTPEKQKKEKKEKKEKKQKKDKNKKEDEDQPEDRQVDAVVAPGKELRMDADSDENSSPRSEEDDAWDLCDWSTVAAKSLSAQAERAKNKNCRRKKKAQLKHMKQDQARTDFRAVATAMQ